MTASAPPTVDTDTKTVGLIAGWGRYPIVIAEELKRQGHRVVCAAVRDHCATELRPLCDTYREFGLGRLGTALRYFRREGVSHATMAGKVHKVLLFRPRVWIHHIPDWECIRTFFPHFATRTQDRKDDTLLLAVVNAFLRHGVEIAPATDIFPELLVKEGPLSRRHPTRSEEQDIAFGWELAKEMGRLDVGQSVAVKGRAVVAVEAVEGTDACIRRAGELSGGGFSLVKVAKPNQDMRFDVPTVGVGTIESLVAAGGKVLAIEAHQTILIDCEDVVALANRHGIAIVALQMDQSMQRRAA